MCLQSPDRTKVSEHRIALHPVKEVLWFPQKMQVEKTALTFINSESRVPPNVHTSLEYDSLHLPFQPVKIVAAPLKSTAQIWEMNL